MAISAISSISAGGSANPFRISGLASIGRNGSVPRVEPIPSIDRETGRREATHFEESGSAAETAKEGRRDSIRITALDPRGPESILGARKGSGLVDGADTRRRISDRLAELMGERAALEGRQAQQKNQSSAEVVSELSQLKARDAQVRAHEAAHMAAGGRYITGGASYTYERGPDGGEYAVGGEVGIDASPVPGNPEETAQKMRTVRAAALAPIDPSAADLAVAAAADETEAAALAQIAEARAEELAKGYAQAAGGVAASGSGRVDTGGREGTGGRQVTGGRETAPREPVDMIA